MLPVPGCSVCTAVMLSLPGCSVCSNFPLLVNNITPDVCLSKRPIQFTYIHNHTYKLLNHHSLTHSYNHLPMGNKRVHFNIE